jgi:hypothetical protein
MKRTLLLAAILLVFPAANAAAVQIPPFDVNKFHNASSSLSLPAAQAQAMERKLFDFERDYGGVQMAVLSIESLDNEPLGKLVMRIC